ncbi:MAG: hypothetical protein R2771_13950 [Saprospiraceae bacterium]
MIRYSLSLCNPENDNNNGENWQASGVWTQFTYNGVETMPHLAKAITVYLNMIL